MTTKQLTLTSILLLTIQLSTSGQTGEENLTGSIWISEVVPGYCYDSLQFNTDSTAIYYSCEESFHYGSEYNFSGDSIQLAILEIFKNEKWPLTIRTLKFEEGELKQVRILERSHHKLFAEVDSEIYKQVKNFIKLEN